MNGEDLAGVLKTLGYAASTVGLAWGAYLLHPALAVVVFGMALFLAGVIVADSVDEAKWKKEAIQGASPTLPPSSPQEALSISHLPESGKR